MINLILNVEYFQKICSAVSSSKSHIFPEGDEMNLLNNASSDYLHFTWADQTEHIDPINQAPHEVTGKACMAYSRTKRIQHSALV